MFWVEKNILLSLQADPEMYLSFFKASFWVLFLLVLSKKEKEEKQVLWPIYTQYLRTTEWTENVKTFCDSINNRKN